jgi:hypothetical protein
MARFDSTGLRRIAWALLVAALVLPASTQAQSLQRLTVTQLTLSADTAEPHTEQPFRLIVTAHVREKITELDNLVLPILAELELLGDTRTVAATGDGTTYRETIEVVAHHTGTITIAPVTLDAVDVRDSRAKRYWSNALTLQVGAFAPRRNAPNTLWIPVLFGVISAAICWIVLTARRRRPPAPVALTPITLPPPVPVKRDPHERIREWLTALRAHPDRHGAMQVRSAVRRAVGANDTQTLADVLRRPLAQDPPMRTLLRLLERAGFTHDGDVPAAVHAAITHLEEMVSGP